MQNEVAFLLSILNAQFTDGRESDNHPMTFIQTMIIHRLLALGLWTEFHPDRHLWYVHCNDESGRWEQ